MSNNTMSTMFEKIASLGERMCWKCLGKSIPVAISHKSDHIRKCQGCASQLISKKAFAHGFVRCVKCRFDQICERCCKNVVNSSTWHQGVTICKSCRIGLCKRHHEMLWPTQYEKWMEEDHRMNELDRIDEKTIFKR